MSHQVVEELLTLFDGRRADVRRLAEQAGRLWDLAEAARVRVEADGVLLNGPHGPIQHPAAALERQSRLAFMSCIRVLRQRPPREKLGRRTSTERVAADAPKTRNRYIRTA